MNDRYTSDLTDEQWDLIRQFLPAEQDGPGRPMELQPREVVNAILSMRFCTSCALDASGTTFQMTSQTPTACIITTEISLPKMVSRWHLAPGQSSASRRGAHRPWPRS